MAKSTIVDMGRGVCSLVFTGEQGGLRGEKTEKMVERKMRAQRNKVASKGQKQQRKSDKGKVKRNNKRSTIVNGNELTVAPAHTRCLFRKS